MKAFAIVCIFIFSVALSLGDATGELKCQQCLELMSLVKDTSNSFDLPEDQINDENDVCASECSQDNELVYDFYVSLKECQMCINAVNKINQHASGRDAHALTSAISYGCSMFDFTCKSFINANKSQLVHLLQSSKDGHVVCRGVHKC